MWTEAEQLPRVGKRPAVSSSQNYCSPKCAPPVHKSPINVDVSMAQILSWDVKQFMHSFTYSKSPIGRAFCLQMIWHVSIGVHKNYTV